MMTPPRQDGEPPKPCIAWLLVLVLGGCRVRGRRCAILQHTPSTEHTCRGVQAS